MTEDKENVVSKGSKEETLSSASAPKSNNTETTSDAPKAAGTSAGHGAGSYDRNKARTGDTRGGASGGNNSGGYNNYNNRGGTTGTGTGTGARRPFQFNKRRFVFKKKECYFTKNNVPYVDYKDVNLLKMFVGYNGQILISRFTGLKPKYQRRAAIAVKRARFMALLPFVGEVKKYNPRRDERQGQGGQGDFKPRGAHDDHNRAPIGGDASAVASATSAATSVPTSTPAPTTNDTAVADKDNSASGVTNGE